MALNLGCIGQESEPFIFEVSWQQAALYALAVGAAEHHLHHVYEALGPRPIPSLAVVPGYPVLRALRERLGGNSRRAVHVGQTCRLFQALTVPSTWRSTGRVAGVYSLRHFALVRAEVTTRDQRGERVAQCEWDLIYPGEGGFSGEAPPVRAKLRPPARPPERVEVYRVPHHAAWLYRLLGDENPLHIDPNVAREAGYPNPIVHGLYTYGSACLHALCDLPMGQVSAGTGFAIAGEFHRPLEPGQTMDLSFWRLNDGVFVRVLAGGRAVASCQLTTQESTLEQ